MADTIIVETEVARAVVVSTTQIKPIVLGQQGPAGTPGGGAAIYWNETPSGVRDGGNRTFTLAHTPSAGKIILSLNGLILQQGSGNDYTVSGVTITIDPGAVIPIASDILTAFYSL